MDAADVEDLLDGYAADGWAVGGGGGGGGGVGGREEAEERRPAARVQFCEEVEWHYFVRGSAVQQEKSKWSFKVFLRDSFQKALKGALF